MSIVEKALNIDIETSQATLHGDLTMPDHARGLVIFVHGSGSSRLSPRNRHVAQLLNEAGLATLLFDLLTPQEEEADRVDAHLRFNIEFLANRLADTVNWVLQQEDTRHYSIGFFGASTGAAAALLQAAHYPDQVEAIVSRGGRPDLVLPALPSVRAATMLIVGGDDFPVIQMNQKAYRELLCEKRLETIAGATHLFEEPGALEKVAELAGQWFASHLTATHPPHQPVIFKV